MASTVERRVYRDDTPAEEKVAASGTLEYTAIGPTLPIAGKRVRVIVRPIPAGKDEPQTSESLQPAS